MPKIFRKIEALAKEEITKLWCHLPLHAATLAILNDRMGLERYYIKYGGTREH
jgi:hypothetical protein